MRKTLSILPVLFLCGCISPVSVPTVSHWLLEYRHPSAVAAKPRYGIARLSQVIVNLPYANERFVVLKSDGSVAFDACNVFAAPPPALMRSVCYSALLSSGLFTDVSGASSGATAEVSVEFVVNQLAIDCRQANSRRAVAEVCVRVLKGNAILTKTEGSSAADASDGDYGVAFSKAVSAAISSALSRLW